MQVSTEILKSISRAQIVIFLGIYPRKNIVASNLKYKMRFILEPTCHKTLIHIPVDLDYVLNIYYKKSINIHYFKFIQPDVDIFKR